MILLFRCVCVSGKLGSFGRLRFLGIATQQKESVLYFWRLKLIFESRIRVFFDTWNVNTKLVYSKMFSNFWVDYEYVNIISVSTLLCICIIRYILVYMVFTLNLTSIFITNGKYLRKMNTCIKMDSFMCYTVTLKSPQTKKFRFNLF